jgi:pimeloyl-ACP methyl ester carboxylesterase
MERRQSAQSLFYTASSVEETIYGRSRNVSLRRALDGQHGSSICAGTDARRRALPGRLWKLRRVTSWTLQDGMRCRGGKVALEAARIGAVASLEHIVVIDSAPGSRDPSKGNDSVFAVIDSIESLPATFTSRTELIKAFVATGQSLALAQWLAASVEKDGEHLRFKFDLKEIRSLLEDYFARDLWPVVEQPPGNSRVHLVIGDRSGSYSQADRERAARIADSNDRVTLDILPAGHWVHVDDPDGLLRVMLQHIA